MSTHEIWQRPVYLRNETGSQPLDADGWLSKAQKLLLNGDTWSKEDSSRFESFMSMYAATRASMFDRELYNSARERHIAARRLDSAVLAFFAGRRFEVPVVGESGVRIEQRSADGRPAVAEMRTYLPLSTDPASAGDVIPTGFLGEVLAQAKQSDQLLDAARWIFTATGNPLNYPAVDSTNSSIDAAPLAELGAITQGPNPVFAQTQYPEATTWVTPQFLYSVQLEQDSPVLAATFTEMFAKSFARGMGSSFLTSLLSAITSALTTSSPSAIAGSEIYSLMSSIDTAYAIAPGAGFLMNYKTLLGVRQITTSGGQLMFPEETVNGRPGIAGKPVFLCPNMSDIGAGNVPVIFGDLQRLSIRAVTDSFSAFRYDEKYMQAHQKAIQAFWRVDSLYLKASSSDESLKKLTMHS